MTDRNFRQEFIDAYMSLGFPYETASTYARRLSPTGHENISMLQSAYLFATLENDRFDMNNWVDSEEFDDLQDGVHERPLVTKENVVSCKTTFCLAGSVAAFNLGNNEGMDTDGNIYSLKKIRGTNYLDLYVDSPEDRGMKLMGLSVDQASILFYLPNDIDLVKAALNYIAQCDLSVKELNNA